MRCLMVLAAMALAAPAVAEPWPDAQSRPAVAHLAVEGLRVTLAPYLRAAEGVLPWDGLTGLGGARGQVETVVAVAAEQATWGMTEGQAVTVELLLRRFDLGGPGQGAVMQLDLTLRDAATGAVVEGPSPVTAHLPAVPKATRAMITAALTEAIRLALSDPFDPLEQPMPLRLAEGG